MHLPSLRHWQASIRYQNPALAIAGAYADNRKNATNFAILVKMKELNSHIDQIRKLCSSNNVKFLFAFGSVTTDQFNADSDIDLLVDFRDIDPLTYTDHYFNLKFELEKILKRPIDLLEFKSLKNPYIKEQIEKNKVQLYGE